MAGATLITGPPAPASIADPAQDQSAHDALTDLGFGDE